MIMEIAFDIETLRPCRPSDPSKIVEGVDYALSWPEEAARDFAGMGIACVVVQELEYGEEWRYSAETYVSDLDLRIEVQSWLDQSSRYYSFAGDDFDLKLLRQNGFRLDFAKSFDLRTAIRQALGIPDDGHTGITLDGLAIANNIEGKSKDSGAAAPILWQQGDLDRVINGCSGDVRIVRGLVGLVRRDGGLWLPDRGVKIGSGQRAGWLPLEIPS